MTPEPWPGWRSCAPTSPIHRCPNGAWFLSRYDDVLAATKDVATFRASFREPGVEVPDEEQFINEIPEPRHGHVRRIINSAIAQHRIARVEPIARELCDDSSTSSFPPTPRPHGRIDLVAGYSTPIPTTVIAHLLGAPVADHHRWAEWSDEVVQGTYPTKYRTERGVGLEGAHPEFTAYVDEQIRVRRDAAEPPDDFITRLLQHRSRRSPTHRRRGPDSARVPLHLGERDDPPPDLEPLLHPRSTARPLRRRCRADRGLVDNLVEETLRLMSPIQFLMRTCTRDTAMHGVDVATTTRSRSELRRRIATPCTSTTPTSSASTGRTRKATLRSVADRTCARARPCARLEARIAIDGYSTRVAAIDLAPGYEFEKVPVFWAYGPASLPVTLELRPDVDR